MDDAKCIFCFSQQTLYYHSLFDIMENFFFLLCEISVDEMTTACNSQSVFHL